MVWVILIYSLTVVFSPRLLFYVFSELTAVLHTSQRKISGKVKKTSGVVKILIIKLTKKRLFCAEIIERDFLGWGNNFF